MHRRAAASVENKMATIVSSIQLSRRLLCSVRYVFVSTRERAENLEYRNQLSGVCWGTVYCSINSIFFNHPVYMGGGVPKTYGHTSRVSSHENSKKYVWVVFEFSRNISFNNKYLNFVIYYWQITQYVCSTHVPNWISVEFTLYIKSQFTTDAQNVSHLNQCTHGHVWSCTVALLQKAGGGGEWFDTHEKCVGEVSLHFQLELNTLEVLNVVRDKNTKHWGQANVVAVPRKLLVRWHVLMWTLIVLLRELSPEVRSSILGTHSLLSPSLSLPLSLSLSLYIYIYI